MKKFNIYYGYNKINTKPLKDEEVENIMNKKYIYKIINNQSVRIKTSDVRIIKCTIL
jgi:hypothetical protein